MEDMDFYGKYAGNSGITVGQEHLPLLFCCCVCYNKKSLVIFGKISEERARGIGAGEKK